MFKGVSGTMVLFMIQCQAGPKCRHRRERHRKYFSCVEVILSRNCVTEWRATSLIVIFVAIWTYLSSGLNSGSMASRFRSDAHLANSASMAFLRSSSTESLACL